MAGPAGLAGFNDASDADATAALTACCDVPRWVDTVLRGRPYDTVDALLATADGAGRNVGAAEVGRALAAHPRIGEQSRGADVGAQWSRDEQAGVGQDSAAPLAEANRAYEQRFRRVFLICATGRSAADILDAARERLGHDDETELRVTADELRQIALLRLRKLVTS